MNETIKKIEMKLDEPFDISDVEWGISEHGTDKKTGELFVKALPFVKGKAIENRLDEAVGKFGWKFTTRVERGNSELGRSRRTQMLRKIEGFVGTISIYCRDLGWIYKEDGSEFTSRYAYKGGITGAFKRVASKWGIGRYLAEVGERKVVATFDEPDEDDLINWRCDLLNFSKDKYDDKNNRQVWWQEPSMPLEYRPLSDSDIAENLRFIENAKTQMELQSAWNMMTRRLQGRLQEKYEEKLKELVVSNES